MKRVRRVDGFVVTRPAKDHPNMVYWAELREATMAKQVDELGRTHCGTCPDVEGPFDLHHRHYNNFYRGELPSDVILLCRHCHDAITNRIRAWRQAHGDQTFDGELSIEQGPTQRFQPTRKATAVIEAEVATPTRSGFRPSLKDRRNFYVEAI